MSTLASKKCKPCEGGVAPYTEAQARDLLKQLKGWILEGFRTFADVQAEFMARLGEP